MMKTLVITGSKNEIAENVARIDGIVREAIVFVEEPGDANLAAPHTDIFGEMDPFIVQAGGADYSRHALYSRAEGE
jgi:hypothetical protein